MRFLDWLLCKLYGHPTWKTTDGHDTGLCLRCGCVMGKWAPPPRHGAQPAGPTS